MTYSFGRTEIHHPRFVPLTIQVQVFWHLCWSGYVPVMEAAQCAWCGVVWRVVVVVLCCVHRRTWMRCLIIVRRGVLLSLINAYLKFLSRWHSNQKSEITLFQQHLASSSNKKKTRCPYAISNLSWIITDLIEDGFVVRQCWSSQNDCRVMKKMSRLKSRTNIQKRFV